VALNRPEKMNAMNNLMWEEIGAVFDRLARDPDCRAIVLRQGERVKSC
jgi:delta(3,5)-delta(2,4)-dienoyl-CoA isomerase